VNGFFLVLTFLYILYGCGVRPLTIESGRLVSLGRSTNDDFPRIAQVYSQDYEGLLE
jgi:hypothetical protein